MTQMKTGQVWRCSYNDRIFVILDISKSLLDWRLSTYRIFILDSNYPNELGIKEWSDCYLVLSEYSRVS